MMTMKQMCENVKSPTGGALRPFGPGANLTGDGFTLESTEVRRGVRLTRARTPSGNPVTYIKRLPLLDNERGLYAGQGRGPSDTFDNARSLLYLFAICFVAVCWMAIDLAGFFPLR